MEKKSAHDRGHGDERMMEHHVRTVVKPVGEVIQNLVNIHVRPSLFAVYTISQRVNKAPPSGTDCDNIRVLKSRAQLTDTLSELS